MNETKSQDLKQTMRVVHTTSFIDVFEWAFNQGCLVLALPDVYQVQHGMTSYKIGAQ